MVGSQTWCFGSSALWPKLVARCKLSAFAQSFVFQFTFILSSMLNFKSFFYFQVFCTADWSCLKSCLRNLRNVRCEKGPGSPTSNRAWKESVALLLAQLTARFIAWKDVRKIGLLGFEMQASAKPAKASGETSRDSRSEGVRSSPLHSLGGGKVPFAAAICFVIPTQHTCKTTRRRTPGGDTAHGPRRSSWDRVQTACRKVAWICSQGYLLPLPVCSADDLCFFLLSFPRLKAAEKKLLEPWHRESKAPTSTASVLLVVPPRSWMLKSELWKLPKRRPSEPCRNFQRLQSLMARLGPVAGAKWLVNCGNPIINMRRARRFSLQPNKTEAPAHKKRKRTCLEFSLNTIK